MKYFVTAVLAMALAGAAATAQADPPPDKQDHKEARAPRPEARPAPRAARPAPAKRTESTAVNKQRTLDTEDARLHQEQKAANSETLRAHSEQRNIDTEATHERAEQKNVNTEATKVRAKEAAVDRTADRGHPGLGYQSHGLRPNDRGRVAYSVDRYPQRFSVGRRFHLDNYAYPGGWYARSWNYGDYLPGGWFAPQFYLNFGAYGLNAPPIGCEWVREGPDAVLVDVWTGQVLSVASGVFY